MSPFLAATDAAAIPVWLNVFANFGGFGILAYYFIMRKPHEDREARQEVKDALEAANKSRQQDELAMRQAYLDESERQRQYDRERSALERQLCEDRQRELLKIFEGGQKQIIAMMEVARTMGESGILKKGENVTGG